MPHIYTRADWGARTPDTARMATQNDPVEAFLHHSDDADAARLTSLTEQAAKVRQIQGFHMDTRGWSDIAYHYVVLQPYGFLRRARVFQGRAVNRVPAAQLNHNTGTLAICVVGANEKLKRNTRFAIEQLIKQHQSVQTLGGHRDVVATECPGAKIYSWIPTMARATNVRVYKG